MIKLTLIELKKQFKKTSIKILYLFIFLTCFLTIYFVNNKKELDETNTYRSIEVLDKNNVKQDYSEYLRLTKNYNKNVEESIKLYNYNKENNNALKEKKLLDTSFTIITFMSIIVVLISSSILREEANKKSIKELLTKPYKRWKILTSKILCVFVLTLFITIFIAICYILIGSFLSSNNLLTLKIATIKNNSIQLEYYIFEYMKQIFLYSYPLYFIGIFTMFLSIIINSSKIVSGIGIFLSLMSTLLFQLLLKIDFTFVEYLFLPYLDFGIFRDIYNIYLININYGININIICGIVVLFFYSIIIYFISLLIFNKKDILN